MTKISEEELQAVEPITDRQIRFICEYKEALEKVTDLEYRIDQMMRINSSLMGQMSHLKEIEETLTQDRDEARESAVMARKKAHRAVHCGNPCIEYQTEEEFIPFKWEQADE